VSKYVRQKLMGLREKIHKSMIMIGDFIILLSATDRSNRQKFSIVDLNSTINQLFLIDILKMIYPLIAEKIFSCSHATFTKIDQIIGNKIHINTFKIIKIIQCFHNMMK